MPYQKTVGGAARHSFVSPMLRKSDYYRPLEKTELCEILCVDGIEFELLLVNKVLRPSVSIEYHPGRFLGFFNYWDCLAVKILEVTENIESLENTLEGVDEMVSYIEGTSLRGSSERKEFAANSNENSFETIAHVTADEINDRFPDLQMQVVGAILEVVRDMQDRFTIIAAEEVRYDFSPFSIDFDEFGEFPQH